MISLTGCFLTDPCFFHYFILCRLVPTLARYGFVEAVMIIRENGAAISALVEVFESGGGVGDAILAIENTVSKNQELAVTTRRNRRLKIEADLLQKDYSTFNAIVAINNAKSVSTPTVDTVLTDEIELIPGTTRIHTRSELILPTNPSVAQVKTLARDIMNNKLQADKIYYGKVSERTKKEIAVLYEQVSCALRIYENSPEAVLGYERDFESPPLSKGTVLCCTLLYCPVLHCYVLHCIVLCSWTIWTVLYCTALC